MMVTSFRVVLDACSLVPITLCDMLLSLADHRFYVPLWTNDILDEMERALTRILVESGMPSDDATLKTAYRREQMMLAFPDAMVTGFEALVPAMTNDLKDRHVLAAAVRASASTIVTANVADFPESSASPYAIEVKHPDLFLMDLLGFDVDLVLKALGEMTAQKKKPPMTRLAMLQRIAKSAPQFAAAVLIQLES